MCVKARESARKICSRVGELILFWTLFFLLPFFRKKKSFFSLFFCSRGATPTQIIELSFLFFQISFDDSRPSSREEAPATRTTDNKDNEIIITTRKSSFSNHQYGLGRVSTRIGARRERHAKVFTETKQTLRISA